MPNPDYNLDELFTELLSKVNMPDEEKEKYMNEFDSKSLSEKIVLMKLLESKYKYEKAQLETKVIDAQIKRGI